ncbi:MAG: two-component regulator propeller domain-containing protein [Pseudomonadota bacterium]
MLKGIVATIGSKTRRVLSGLSASVVLLASLLIPQVHAADAQPMRFDHITRDDGLAQNAVMAMVQDNHGFMWFATENGLDRFNGYDFQHYRSDRSDNQSLPNNFVLALSLDDLGNVWAATDGGGIALWQADTGEFQVLRHNPTNENSIADNNVRTLVWDPRGYVWIGTLRHGLDRYEIATGTFTHYRANKEDPNSISNDEIYAISLSETGVWVGTNYGLNHLDLKTDQFTTYVTTDDATSLSDNRVRSLLTDSEGVLWVGTRLGGLNQFDASTKGFVRYQKDQSVAGSLSNDRVEVIFEDQSKRLWVGTADGLNLMDRVEGRFYHYRHKPEDPTSLSGNYIISMFQDRGGLIWVGTKLSGISKWNPRSWSFGHSRPVVEGSGDFRRNHVTSFAQDSLGQTYVGTFGAGLMVMDAAGNVIREYRKDNESHPLSDDRVMTLLVTNDDVLYVGTMTGGLNRIDVRSGDSTVFRHDANDASSLAADGVMSLFQDSKDRVWVGTFGGGVSRVDGNGQDFVSFRHDEKDPTSLSSPRATAIAEDKQGVIWVGTDGGGLNRYDATTDSWARFAFDPQDIASLSANTVYSLHVDPKGTLWVGTRAGLDRLLQGSDADPTGVHFKHVSEREGLSHSAIYGIRSDNLGNLWLSTNGGLARYGVDTGAIRVFHTGHGLQGEEFNVGAHYSGLDGRLFFGGSDGYNAFYPEQITENTKAPEVALVSLQKLNQPVDFGMPHEKISSVDFEHTDDVVTFEFAALDYTASGTNVYQYKLEGFDPEWVDSGNRHRVTYTNLSGGEYVFKVRAANSDGVWSEKDLSIDVHVEQAPWLTWWAYTMYVVALFGLIWSIWSAQQRKLAREAEYSRRLEAEVKARTSELADRNADLEIVNAQLHEASHTDALTGLRNRRYFFEQVSEEISSVPVVPELDRRVPYSYGADYVFIMVDLDHFKPVNDTHGHVAGDQMLLQVKDVLLNSVRSTDVVIRWGGDEFLVVARQASDEEACELVERIRSNIAATVFSLGSGQVARTTTSIGFAAYPFLEDRKDLLTWEQVLKIADLAMYESKEQRNAWTGISGVDFDGSADRLVEALHNDLEQLCDDGNIIIIESLKAAQEQTA